MIMPRRQREGEHLTFCYNEFDASNSSIYLISILLQILPIQLIPLILGNYRNNCYFLIDTGLPLKKGRGGGKKKKNQ